MQTQLGKRGTKVRKDMNECPVVGANCNCDTGTMMKSKKYHGKSNMAKKKVMESEKRVDSKCDIDEGAKKDEISQAITPLQAIQAGESPIKVLKTVVEGLVIEWKEGEQKPVVTPKNTPARSPGPWETAHDKKRNMRSIAIERKGNGGVEGKICFDALSAIEEDETEAIE